MDTKKMKSNVFYYKKLLQKIEILLDGYTSKDKDYLISENNHLKNKCQNGEKILKKLKISTEENDEEFQNYLEDIKLGIRDFLLLLRWNNFGALKLKIKEIKTIKLLFEDEDQIFINQ